MLKYQVPDFVYSRDMESESLWTTKEIEDIAGKFLRLPHSKRTESSPANSVFPDQYPSQSLFSVRDFEGIEMALDLAHDADAKIQNPRSALPNVTYTFKIDRQRYTGAHHGKGGRPRALTGVQLLESIPIQISRSILRYLLSCCSDQLLEVASQLKNAYLDVLRSQSMQNFLDIPQDYCLSFKNQAETMLHVLGTSGYEIVKAPLLCICFKVPRSKSLGPTSKNPMGRHATCTWLSIDGRTHCSCIGSTQSRVTKNHGNVNDREDCVHTAGMRPVIAAVSNSFNTAEDTAGKIIARFVLRVHGTELSPYSNALPRIYTHHKGAIIVVATNENPSDAQDVWFVPVRHITKGFVRDICAFCDNIISPDCHHTRTIAILREEETGVDSNYDFSSVHAIEEVSDQSVSILPLSPVNCRRALEVDETICLLARRGISFTLKAPMLCGICGSKRNEHSLKILSSGIVMCTIGPCRMDTEEYRCSSSSCGASISAEGRSSYIILDTLRSGATHALMRRELHGVVLSNGTLTGRLRHFHSLVTANILFGVIPSEPQCRSVKTLSKLCAIMLRLMCMSPPPELFQCNVCEINGQKIKALCMDGISQGFVKQGARPFENISEPCIPLKPSTLLSSGRADAAVRPLISLIREERPVRILLQAIRGKPLRCSKDTEKDFGSAIRLVSDSAIPRTFHSISVCGKSRGDFFNDVGSQCVLENLRRFVTSIFDTRTLLFRLLGALRDFSKDRSLHDHIKAHVIPCSNVYDDGEVCWRSHIRDSSDCHIHNDMLNLVRMLLQGPIVQFVRESDVPSLGRLAELCCAPLPEELKEALLTPSLLLETNSGNQTNILSSLKILHAGVFSSTALEDAQGISTVRMTIGAVLKDCKYLVHRFYNFYNKSTRTESAFLYERRWRSSNASELTSLMEQRHGNNHPSHILLSGNSYDLAIRTGSYFPGRPQLRPLPFNDEEGIANQFESAAHCSKDFLQRQKSFTPGALTFCCSCSHPKILGFKILYRNEGPRAILDTVVSRFAELPSYLIYDFCCGLFISAIHCLWWAVAQVTVVCDNFHFKNHSCSPSYSPRLHFRLQSTNTVAHEQRNRAITKLGLSLRNCKLNLYVSLLAFQTIVLNIRSQAKSSELFQNRTTRFAEFDLEWCFFHCVGLHCTCCQTDDSIENIHSSL